MVVIDGMFIETAFRVIMIAVGGFVGLSVGTTLLLIGGDILPIMPKTMRIFFGCIFTAFGIITVGIAVLTTVGIIVLPGV
jgi:hypothetical protein